MFTSCCSNPVGRCGHRHSKYTFCCWSSNRDRRWIWFQTAVQGSNKSWKNSQIRHKNIYHPPPLTSGPYLVLEISSDVIPQPGVCKSTRRRLDFLFPFSSVFIHFPGTLQTLWFDVIEILHRLVLVSCSRPMVNVLYIYFPVTTYRLRCC